MRLGGNLTMHILSVVAVSKNQVHTTAMKFSLACVLAFSCASHFTDALPNMPGDCVAGEQSVGGPHLGGGGREEIEGSLEDEECQVVIGGFRLGVGPDIELNPATDYQWSVSCPMDIKGIALITTGTDIWSSNQQNIGPMGNCEDGVTGIGHNNIFASDEVVGVFRADVPGEYDIDVNVVFENNVNRSRYAYSDYTLTVLEEAETGEPTASPVVETDEPTASPVAETDEPTASTGMDKGEDPTASPMGMGMDKGEEPTATPEEMGMDKGEEPTATPEEMGMDKGEEPTATPEEPVEEPTATPGEADESMSPAPTYSEAPAASDMTAPTAPTADAPTADAMTPPTADSMTPAPTDPSGVFAVRVFVSSLCVMFSALAMTL